MNKKLLGRKINTARKDRGLTSEKLSELCSINATYLRQIEAGIKTPSLPLFVQLCETLSVSPSYLLSDNLSNRLDGGDELIKLCQNASPGQLRLITALVTASLQNLEQ